MMINAICMAIKQICQFKAIDNLGSVFKDFTKLEMNEIALIVAIYDFSIDDDVTNIENILVIFDYLSKKI